MIAGVSAITSGLATSAPGGIAGAASSNLATTTSGTEASPSFASVLANAAGNTVNSLKQAEQMSIDALQGKADMRAVVDTVMSAEQSLQAAVAIRDKIVSAYLEVSRMAI
jgi:flagellar hook-basal body complex protein FliE